MLPRAKGAIQGTNDRAPGGSEAREMMMTEIEAGSRPSWYFFGVRWGLFSLIVALAGCASLTGIDQYTKGGDAAPNDATSDVKSADASKDQAGGSDAGTDAGNDSSDASSTSDCGPTNTVQNCSACGLMCDMTNASQTTCNGTSCVYTCQNGFADCNNTAPNLNGCECATNGCCGSSCQTTHSNGLGQNFYDCVAQGTHDQTQATKACTAYTSNMNVCLMYSCMGGGQNKVVCGPLNGKCACWNFSGSNVGRAHLSQDATCVCPAGNDPAWN